MYVLWFMAFSQVINSTSSDYIFNATLGYPGEGSVSCQKCQQIH